MVGEHVLPPFLFVHFLQVDVNELLVLCRESFIICQEIQRDPKPTNCPGTVLNLYLFAELAVKKRFLALETHRELLLEDLDVQISRAGSLGNRNYDVNFAKLLFPCVGKS